MQKNLFTDDIMNILLVLDAVLPVTGYGGTERVIWYLGKELARMNHNVTFLSGKGTECEFAKVICINTEKSIESQIPEDIEVTHFNNYIPVNFERPYVITCHGNHTGSNPIDRNTIFVSKNHALRHGSKEFVYNGLDWDDYGKADFDIARQYFHFLGKAAWRVKNVKGAINIIKSVPGARLKVIGGNRLNFKMGFRFTLSPKIEFMGISGGSRKLDILRKSKGLVFPVKWDEPFGLAIIESLYFGAPVFGTPYGSLPELVIPEVGFLSCEKDKIASHIIRDYNYNPRICHEYAADMFNSRKMAEEYIKNMKRYVTGHILTMILCTRRYRIKIKSG